MLRAARWTAVLVCSLFGCIGGQTGEGDSSEPWCKDQRVVTVALDELTALGFAASELLALTEQREPSEADGFSAWVVDEDGQNAPDPGTAPTALALSLRVNPRVGSARMVERVLVGGASGSLTCPSRLEVDVDVVLRLASEADTFEANFPGTLTGDSKHLAQVSGSIAIEAASGTLIPTLSEGEWLSGFDWVSVWSRAGQAGTLSARSASTHYPLGWREGAQPEPTGDAPRALPSTVERSVPLAEWPANNRCAAAEIPLEVDSDVFGVTPRDAMALFSGQTSMAWVDGSQTVLEVSVSPGAGTICLQPTCNRLCAGLVVTSTTDDRIGIGVPIALTLRTQDGRWNGVLQALLLSQALHDGGFGQLSVEIAERFASAERFREAIGFAPHAWDAGAEAAFFLRLVLDVEAGESALRGAFNLSLVRPPEACSGQCTGGPNSFELVERATIGED